MKKNDIIQVIIVVVLTAMALIVFGCKTPQPIVQTEVKEVVVEREVRDTIVTIQPDSASIKALLECDSAGNVLIKELQEEQGKNVALEMALKNKQSDKGESAGATLEIDCKADSLQMVIDVQNEHIHELNDIISKHVEEIKYIPDIVKWLAWIGGFALLYVLIRIGLWVYRKFVLKV
jgi:hypothetical protein